MDKKSIVTLAFDLTKGFCKDHSVGEGVEVLRQALVDLNGGSKFDYKSFRRNKIEIYEIIEELIPMIVTEKNKDNELFRLLVEERNAKEGDTFEFEVEDRTEFVVAEMARGIATPRRQRIHGKSSVAVHTTTHGIRIYEEFARFIAGRIDWNALVDGVARAYNNKVFDDIFAALSGITQDTPGMNSELIYGGTYSEAEILSIVDKLEGMTGRRAVIYGTKAALRKCESAVQSEEAKKSYYNNGYWGKLAGTDMVCLPNIYDRQNKKLIFPDNKLWILAGDDRPIKYCTEGEVYMSDTTEGNADMTIEHTLIARWGVAIVVGSEIGLVTLA